MSEPIEVCLEVLQETDAAFRLTDGTNLHGEWVPKSQLEHSEDPGVGDTIVFEMPEWLAIEKGFI